MDFRDYLRAVQRRWFVVLIVTAGVVGIGYYFVQREPTVYTARAEILIRENPYFFQAGEYQALFPDYFSKATRAALLRNRPVLQHAIRTQLQRYYPGTAEDTPQGRQEMTNAILRLRAGLAVSQEKDLEIITVSYSDLDGQRAVDIVNAVVQSFEVVSRERQQEGVQRAIEFIKETRGEREREREKLVVRLRELGLPKNDLLTAQDEQAILKELYALQSAETEMRAKRDVLVAEIDLRSGLLDTPSRRAKEGRAAERLESMELASRLRKSRADLRTLRRRYADHSDQVKRLLQEIALLEAQYAEALEAETKQEIFESQQAEIEAIRLLVLEVRKLDGTLEKNLKAQREVREKHAAFLKKEPDKEIAEERRKEAERAELRNQIKNLEDSIQALGRNRDSLEVNMKKIVSAAERLETAHAALPAPRKGLRTLPLVGISGLILGIGAALLLEYLNTTIRTEHDVKRYVNLTLLGAVPRIRSEGERLLLDATAKTPLGEIFNTIASMLETQARETGARVFMIASSNAAEGKSTVTSNLGIALARGGSRVILVDADLRRAVLHRFFHLEPATGLAHYLAAGAGGAPDGAVPASVDQVLLPTPVENLSIVPAGFHPKNPVNLLKSDRLRTLLQDLKSRADYILVDVPPVRVAVDTLVLAPVMDGVVMLVSAGETSKDDVTFAKRLLEMAKAKLTGCILNKVTITSRGYYYYYYRYYDAYRYYRES